MFIKLDKSILDFWIKQSSEVCRSLNFHCSLFQACDVVSEVNSPVGPWT